MKMTVKQKQELYVFISFMKQHNALDKFIEDFFEVKQITADENRIHSLSYEMIINTVGKQLTDKCKTFVKAVVNADNPETNGNYYLAMDNLVSESLLWEFSKHATCDNYRTLHFMWSNLCDHYNF